MSSIADIIGSFIENWSSKEELYLKVGVASEIDESDFTFKFTPIDEKSIVEDVRMKSIVDGGPEAFVIVPKEGTKVVVGFHSNTVGQCLIVQEAAKVLINTENKTDNISNEYNINCDDVKVATDSWIFNGGGFEGLIKIIDITTKLNDLISELDSLKNSLNSHTHPGVTIGAGVTGPSSTTIGAFTPFVKADYENNKIKH